MRMTQMIAVLKGEVQSFNYHRLSHYNPELYWGVEERSSSELADIEWGEFENVQAGTNVNGKRIDTYG